MAIKLCRECGNQVSTEAATCPKCGVDEPGRELGPGEEITPQAKAKAMQTVGCTIFLFGFFVLAAIVLLAVIFAFL